MFADFTVAYKHLIIFLIYYGSCPVTVSNLLIKIIIYITHDKIYRVSQEERSIFWEVIVSVIVSKTFYMNTCLIQNCFLDRAISLYSCKIVDNVETLCTVFNNYCSNDSSWSGL